MTVDLHEADSFPHAYGPQLISLVLDKLIQTFSQVFARLKPYTKNYIKCDN